MFENLLILEFDTTKEAANFVKSIYPESKGYLVIYDIAPYEAWLCVKGVCDICNYEQIFFIPAVAYEDGIKGTECNECGNMSVYPKEGNWNDENI